VPRVALATPSATSCTRSCVVNAGGPFGSGGGRLGFRGVGSGGGLGGTAGGLGGSDGGPTAPPICGFLQNGGVACPAEIGGIADGGIRLVAAGRFNRMGLHNGGYAVREVGATGGVTGGSEGTEDRRLVCPGALVLGNLAGLLQVCWAGRGGSCGGGGLGDAGGSGIRTARRCMSFRACRNSCCNSATFCWWSIAHSSTFPWKAARCWFLAVLASPRKASTSLTLASCIAWYTCRSVDSFVRSTMACQTFLVKVW